MNSRGLIRFMVFAGLGFSLMAGAAEKFPEKPNVILIYADDMGAGILGCYGQKIIKTPQIDSLANQGVTFTRVYSSQYCCPARASLLTGLHDSHRGVYTQSGGGLGIERDKKGWSREELEEKAEKNIKIKPFEGEVFLPQVFKKAGYVTGQFGKLDWGFMASDADLKRHGWDHYVGYLDHQRAHGFYPKYLWKNGKELPLAGNTHINAGKTPESYGPGSTEKRRNREGKQTYAPDVMLDETLKFMEENKDKPFFVFYSTNLPHGPVDVPTKDLIYEDSKAIDEAYAGAKGGNTECASAAKEYASMVAKLDNHVGAIRQKLEKLGLDKKTLIIFTADNGHELYYRTDKGKGRKLSYHGGVDETTNELIDAFHGSRVKLEDKTINWAGLKWTNWEGGLRVPMIVWGAGVKNPGTKNSSLVANYDHMATFADIVGVKMPDGKDSLSYLAELKGQKTRKEHDYVVIDKTVVTNDGWKLVKKSQGGNNPNPWNLFNLNNDPEERTNLASDAASSAKFEELKAIHEKEVGSLRRDK